MHPSTIVSTRLGALALAALGALATETVAQGDASGYPKGPVKIVVGFTPGGTNDLLARVLAPKLSERIGQPVVVENRPGAGGIIAADFVARSAPDGHTLLMAPAGTLAINPAVYTKLPYDAQKSFEPISNSVTYPFILSVSVDHPAKSAKDLVAWGKANPSKANYGSTSTIFQMATELFKQRTGTTFEHIPFKSGGEIVAAILSGQVTMAFADTGAVLPQIRAGKVRPLATSGQKRLPELPETPTLQESGISGVVVEGFSGIVAPKGTPAATVKRLEAEMMAIIKQPDLQPRLSQLGVQADGSTAAEFAARLAREIPMWSEVARSANIKLSL